MVSVFRPYDIRGVYPEEINEEFAFKLGRAFSVFLKEKNWLKNKKIVIGRDARLSSDKLAQNLIESLVSQPVEVIDLGQCSPPLLYWAVCAENAGGGIMITASHNPANFNGFKICGPEAVPISIESGLLRIKELFEKETIGQSALLGKISARYLLPQYMDFLKKKIGFDGIAVLKIVVDCGNGVIGQEIEQILKCLPVKAEILFAEPDGSFPNHEANPMKEENIKFLKEKVLLGGADLGMAFDGDGDRVIFINEKGEVIRGDFVGALIAGNLLRADRNQKIFYEVRSSRAVPEYIKSMGGDPVLGKAGYTFLRARMKKEEILFGMELSGHYFFRNLNYSDNALAAMLEILKIISYEKKPFSEIIKPLQKYFQSGEMNFEVENKESKLAELKEKYKDAKIKDIDGISIFYKNWWFNLRASNTENFLRLNIEADSLDLLEEKKAELVSFFDF